MASICEAATSGGAQAGKKQPLADSAVPVAVAKGGQALVPITISPDSSKELRGSAAELAGFLTRITGAQFSIEEGTKPKGITLGNIAQFPDKSLEPALAIREAFDGVEAYAIRSSEGAIRLIANTDLGAQNAAYRFLEILGCRWYFPGAAWEIIPTQPELKFAGNENGRPDILARDIWLARHGQADKQEKAAFALWNKGNRMNDSLAVKTQHSWHAIPKQVPEEFKDHPEYFALVKDVRVGPQFCVTNAGLQQAVIKFTHKYFEENPTADMVSLEPADEAGWCTCKDCLALGHQSAQPFYLANIVARDLLKTHPGKMVGLLAYSWHSNPPDFVMEPNVYVMLTAGFNASFYTFEQLLKMWTEKCKHIGIYEYYSHWEMDKSMFPGVSRVANFKGLEERMRHFGAINITSISAESANNWGVHGLGFYLASHLMWDTSADVETLKNDFYQRAFGPAAAPMRRYYERLNLENIPLRGLGLVAECALDLREASEAAKGRPDVLQRIAHLEENVIYTHRGLCVENAVDQASKKKEMLEWFTWSYRTRNNYMNNWLNFRSVEGRSASEVFGEPTWFWRNTLKNPEASPWRVETPVTAAERRERIDNILKEIGPLPKVSTPKFSENYVMVETAQGPAPVSLGKIIFSGKGDILLSSKDGQPLRLWVAKRPTGQQEAQPAKYQLTNMAGEEVAAGEFDTGEHQLELKVPAPGVYRFVCARGGAGWEIAVPEAIPHAVLFPKGDRIRPAQLPSSYFYVPKGTKEIVFYASNASKLTIKNPAGKVAYSGDPDSRYYSLPVAEGMDGLMWSIGGKPHHLWFFNIPTVLSSTRVSAYVPKEVAEKDQLKIISYGQQK